MRMRGAVWKSESMFRMAVSRAWLSKLTKIYLNTLPRVKKNVAYSY